jgi:hypothetical protein
MKLRVIFRCLLLIMASSCSKSTTVPMGSPPSPPPPPIDNPPMNKKWVVSTIAGTGEGSFGNGPALFARFHLPSDVAIAADGSIYVTDIINFRIRKIADGQVNTIAGGSGFAIVDGPGVNAQFNFPFSITLDENGNIYTTDDGDPRIRKINTSNEVFTYAGTGVAGYKDGPKDTAQFKPGGYITSDALGNLYLSDGVNNSIRKIAASGQVTTIAPTYHFSLPGGIVLDKNNNVFAVNRGTFVILKITPDGTVSIVAGNGTAGYKDGMASEAQFSGDMRDLAMDSRGNLYLSDDNRIRKISAEGFVSTIAGSDAGFSDGDSSSARFNYPSGLAINSKDDIYVADLNNNRIRKISFQ